MNIDRASLRRVAFWISIIAGIGLCVGGIFVPVLLVPGASCIAAAAAISRGDDPQGVEHHDRIEEEHDSDIEYVDFRGDRNRNYLVFTQRPRLVEYEDDDADHEPEGNPRPKAHARPK